MAEYIKRETAVDAILGEPTDAHYPEWYASILMGLPAADVAPVVHGKWIYKGEYAVCTECGGRSGAQYDGVEPIPLMTQFCHNCGAKMDIQDGGDNNEVD